MSIEVEPRQAEPAENYEQYRALSTLAVASLVVGILSCLAILSWIMVALPVAGVLIGLLAVVRTRRQRGELAGQRLAQIGLALSIFFGIVGPGWLAYEYATEVPDGYARVNYSELQPEPGQGQLVPPAALDMEGKKIFIKGYVYPGRDKDGIRRFLLVRDQGDCCFGGNPKVTERILVTLDDPLRLSFRSRIHKLGGTFHVEPQNAAIDDAKGGVLYHLKADYLQ